MAHPTIFWDFDGTLAWRPTRWTGALVEALDEVVPGHGVVRAEISPHLQRGFPWHHPETPHPELRDTAVWWARLFEIMGAAFDAVGHGSERARLCEVARRVYVDPASYQVFPDVVPVLEQLRTLGWQHVILSNHVPELGALVDGLGLTDHFEHVITSAHIDYEKPHPEAYRHALRVAGHPERAWMIGDNPIADVRGAEEVGIPSILVRSDHGAAARRAADLHAAVAWIARGDGLRRL